MVSFFKAAFKSVIRPEPLDFFLNNKRRGMFMFIPGSRVRTFLVYTLE